MNVVVSLLLIIIDEGAGDASDALVLLKPALSEAVFKLLLWNEYVPDALFCCWDCFRTTLTHLRAFYKIDVEGENRWKIDFRRPLSHILPDYIWCFRWLWSVFEQHSHTLWFSKKVIIDEKSIFVDPSHTFCLSTYDASEGWCTRIIGFCIYLLLQMCLFVVGTVFRQHSHTSGPSIHCMLKVPNRWKIDFRRHLSQFLYKMLNFQLQLWNLRFSRFGSVSESDHF